MKKWTGFSWLGIGCWLALSCNAYQQLPLPKFAQRLEGNWINKIYLDSLKATQSPQRANKATSVYMFTIRKDSLVDGSSFFLSFCEGEYWLLNKGDVGFFFSNAFDPQLQLSTQLLAPKKMRLGTETFVWYRGALGTDFNQTVVVQDLLFEGCYDWDGKLVEFGQDGFISGMEQIGIRAYQPIVTNSDNSKIDQLWLQEKEATNRYGFEFKDGCLLIYQLLCCNQESAYKGRLKLGKLLFELKKKKLATNRQSAIGCQDK